MNSAWFWIVVIFCSGILIYLSFPKIYCLLPRRWHLPKDFSAGNFSNLITPLLTIGAITTTFAAFMVQTQFNRFQMRKATNEKAEKMVFEFINMHNRLENSIEVTEHVHGKRAFHFMYYEYMSLQNVMNTLRVEQPELLPPVHGLCDSIRRENELTMIIFRSFFYGIDPGNNKALVGWVHEKLGGRYDKLLERYRDEVCKIKSLNDQRLYALYMSNLKPEYYDQVVELRKKILDKTCFLNEYFMADERFLYADGHMPNLDSHMRLMKTILTHFNKLDLGKQEKEYYLDLLRSQLSSHELVVGALYCVTDSDFDWFKTGLLRDSMDCDNALMRNIDSALICKSVPRWHAYVRGGNSPLEYFQNPALYNTIHLPDCCAGAEGAE